MADQLKLPSDFDDEAASTAPETSAPAGPREAATYDAMGNVTQPATGSATASNGADLKLPSDLDEEKGGSLSTLASSPFVGFNRGVANVAGAPVDLVNWGMRKAGLPVSDAPFGGSESIKQGLGVVGANPDAHQPHNVVEKVFQSGGEGAASMLVPELGVQGVARSIGARVAPAIEQMVGSGASPAATAANAVAGSIGSMTGSAAEEAAPERAKPLVNMAGNLIGGGLTGAGIVGARAAKDIIAPKVAEFVEPLTPAGREAYAARTFKEAFTDPAGAAERLDDAAAARTALGKPDDALGQIVPGSRPTTGQLTGDLGILSTERDLATKRPDQFKSNDAGTGAEQQNAARVNALEGLVPNGAPENVSAFLRQRLGEIDGHYAALESAARGVAQDSAGSIGSGQAPEATGSQLRAALQKRLDDTKASERSLWEAIDPGNRMVMPGTSIADAAKSVAGEMTDSALPMSAAEQRVFDAASKYGDATPFREVRDLRSSISTAMREARLNGDAQAVRRLTILRGAVEDSISGAVQHQAELDQQAVARGVLHPEDTIEARARAWEEKLAADAAAHSNRQVSSRVATGAADTSGSRTTAFSSGEGATSAPGRGFGDSAGDPGIPPAPTVVAEATGDLIKAADSATKDRVSTFQTGPVGDVLREGGMKGDYRLSASAVPDTLFRPKNGGGETVRAFLKAAGPHGAPMMEMAAGESLRRHAMTPDGTIDPRRFAGWQKNYAQALSALPPEVSTRFESAAKAAEALNETAAARKQATDQFQQGTIGKIMGLTSPEDIKRSVGSIFSSRTAVREMSKLSAEAARDPAAREGLKKAVADFMADKFLGHTEVGTSGVPAIKPNQFIGFVHQQEPVLKAAGFAPAEISNLRAIAADAERSLRTLNATRLPDQSNTAQDLSAMLTKIQEEGHDVSGLTKAMGAFFTGHPLLASGLAGHYVSELLRRSGLDKAHDLLREAIYNPDVGRALLAKAPVKMSRQSDITWRNVLARQGFAAVQQQGASRGDEDLPVTTIPRPTRATGGRIHVIDGNPSEAQKEAGNYRKAHVRFQGLDIALENAKGAWRRGVGQNGKKWAVRMPAHYGYIKRTEGADGDHLDVYLGPNEKSDKVFVVDQRDADTKKFDECKVMLGFGSKPQALATYRNGFSDGRGGDRLGAVTEMTMGQFKDWIRDGDTKRPAA